MSFKVLPFSVESPYSLSSRDVFSDDPLTQVTARPFFLQCKQAHEASYRCQRLKVI